IGHGSGGVLGASVRPNCSAALSLGAPNHLELAGSVSPKSKETFYGMSIAFEVNCRRCLDRGCHPDRISDKSRLSVPRPISGCSGVLAGTTAIAAWHGR